VRATASPPTAADVWHRWSLRTRTTAAAMAAIAPVLLVAGSAGIWLQRADLTAGIASLAEDQARNLAADAPDEAGVELGGEESIVQVVSLTTGQVEAGSADATEPLVPAPSGSQPEHHQIADPVPDEPDRYEAVALRSADGTSYVVVARSLESVDAAAASTSLILLIGGMLVLLTTGTLTWVATGRALTPVESMRRRAETITAEDLAGRLPVPETQDELARLATTLNDLLARVDRSTRKERQFVADASHELRSPVATIRALLESDQLSPHPGGREGLRDEILAETDRLTAVVNDLLTLARGDARMPTKPQPIDLTVLVTGEARRARKQRVTTQIEAGLVVEGDADLLKVAVSNLLDNAERYAQRTVSVTATTARGHVLVSVTDDGPGVPVADRDRIFERFVRLDDSRSRANGGSGLGLAITRQIADRHGGTVFVTPGSAGSDPPGARFVLALPDASTQKAPQDRALEQ